MTNDVAKLVWDLSGLDPEETLWGYDRDKFQMYLLKMLPNQNISIDFGEDTLCFELDPDRKLVEED